MCIGTHRLLCPHHTHTDAQVQIHTWPVHTCLHVSTDTLIYASLHFYQQMICMCLCITTHMSANIYRNPCTPVQTPLVLVLAPGWYCPLLETADKLLPVI